MTSSQARLSTYEVASLGQMCTTGRYDGKFNWRSMRMPPEILICHMVFDHIVNVLVCMHACMHMPCTISWFKRSFIFFFSFFFRKRKSKNNLILHENVFLPDFGSRCDHFTLDASSVQNLTAPQGVLSNTMSKINTRSFIMCAVLFVERMAF